MRTIIISFLLITSGVLYSQNKASNDLITNVKKNVIPQTRVLTGKITDCEGITLSGVTVLNTNTQKSVQSNSAGKYAIRVNKNDVLLFSLSQYESQRIIVNKHKKIDVKLKVFQNNEPIMVKKPVIYLYPEKPTDVSVKINFKGTMLTTFPKYENGWDLIAYPDGKIFDKKTNRTYNSLFWDGNYTISEDKMKEGFVVEKSNLTAFFIEKLELIGLSSNETNDFIQYWLPILEKNETNFIHFTTNKDYETYSTNIISPVPDTSIRIMMEFCKADKNVLITPQKLVKTNRKGFTLVEWGGCEIPQKLIRPSL